MITNINLLTHSELFRRHVALPTDAPEELRDELESLIVQRDSDEMRIAEDVVQVGESFIV